jgi:hypothetical protein
MESKGAGENRGRLGKREKCMSPKDWGRKQRENEI